MIPYSVTASTGSFNVTWIAGGWNVPPGAGVREPRRTPPPAPPLPAALPEPAWSVLAG